MKLYLCEHDFDSLDKLEEAEGLVKRALTEQLLMVQTIHNIFHMAVSHKRPPEITIEQLKENLEDLLSDVMELMEHALVSLQPELKDNLPEPEEISKLAEAIVENTERLHEHATVH